MKKAVLFVCLGNICRSPAAEAVFSYVVDGKNKGIQFDIDSAGTSAWHAGEQADARMKAHAMKRGYNLTSISRQFNPALDFDRFDLIVAMDDFNQTELMKAAKSASQKEKIKKMTDFCREYGYSSVPDPYYGGEDGFELVLDLLEDACSGLYEYMIRPDK